MSYLKKYYYEKSISDSKALGYKTNVSKISNVFNDWFNNCYTERINDIKGKVWNKKFMRDIFKLRNSYLLQYMTKIKKYAVGHCV